jgi:hypothetical protein
VPETDEESGYTVSVQFRDGIEEPQPEEIMLIQSNLPELLKLMMEELAIVEE